MWSDREALVVRRRVVAGVAAGYLLLVLAGIAVVDVGGTGDWIPARHRGAPLWWALYEEGSPTEWVQALLLVAMVLYAGMGAGRHGEGEMRRFLVLMGVGAAALLLEDTSNIGQWFVRWASLLEAPGESTSWALYRMPVFLVIGAIPTYALVRYRHALRRHAEARRWLLGGYAVYAVVALAGEAMESVLPVYEVVGAFLLDTVLRGALHPVGQTPGVFWGDIEIVFMDYVYEETLELIAITLLLVGVLTLVGRGGAPGADARADRVGSSDAGGGA